MLEIRGTKYCPRTTLKNGAVDITITITEVYFFIPSALHQRTVKPQFNSVDENEMQEIRALKYYPIIYEICSISFAFCSIVTKLTISIIVCGA